MATLQEHQDLMIIDQINEGIDWIDINNSPEHINIGSRIKATPTITLQKLYECDSSELSGPKLIQHDFARKELILRNINENINENGDDHFKKKFLPYSLLSETRDIETKFMVAVDINSTTLYEDLEFSINMLNENSTIDLGEGIAKSRAMKIVGIALRIKQQKLIEYFVNSQDESLTESIVNIKDKWKEFILDLTEGAIKVDTNARAAVKAIKRFGAIDVGETFEGKWVEVFKGKQFRLDLEKLPRATTHPAIFYFADTKTLKIPKQFELIKS